VLRPTVVALTILDHSTAAFSTLKSTLIPIVIRKASVMTEIRTENLPNKNLKRYCYANLLTANAVNLKLYIIFEMRFCRSLLDYWRTELMWDRSLLSGIERSNVFLAFFINFAINGRIFIKFGMSIMPLEANLLCSSLP
jgi:hypothetical protein